MPSHFTHKNYNIDVHIVPDSSGSLFVRPKVDVGLAGGDDRVYLGTSQSFANEKDAELCGFELAIEWIDNVAPVRRHLRLIA